MSRSFLSPLSPAWVDDSAQQRGFATGSKEETRDGQGVEGKEGGREKGKKRGKQTTRPMGRCRTAGTSRSEIKAKKKLQAPERTSSSASQPAVPTVGSSSHGSSGRGTRAPWYPLGRHPPHGWPCGTGTGALVSFAFRLPTLLRKVHTPTCAWPVAGLGGPHMRTPAGDPERKAQPLLPAPWPLSPCSLLLAPLLPAACRAAAAGEQGRGGDRPKRPHQPRLVTVNDLVRTVPRPLSRPPSCAPGSPPRAYNGIVH